MAVMVVLYQFYILIFGVWYKTNMVQRQSYQEQKTKSRVRPNLYTIFFFQPLFVYIEKQMLKQSTILY